MGARTVGLTLAIAICAGCPAVTLAQDQGANIVRHEQTIAPQAQSVARLIRVWGFVKYHHPDARAGRLAMDREWFELFTKVTRAPDVETADRILLGWLEALGPGAPCSACAEDALLDGAEVAMPSTTQEWLASLPSQLQAHLAAMYENRSVSLGNFHIELARGINNPIPLNEADYRRTGRSREPAMRLLMLARQWNILRYWFPYRDVMDQGVHAVLDHAVPEFLAATNWSEQVQAAGRVVAASKDGHVMVGGHLSYLRPSGRCILPYSWRFVGQELVVDGAQSPSDAVLDRGDIVVQINGKTLQELSARYRPLIAASNRGWEDKVLASRLAYSSCGEGSIQVIRQGEAREISVTWKPRDQTSATYYGQHDRAGAAVQDLGDGITYIKLSAFDLSDVDPTLEQAKEGKGLVIDIRGYPKEFVAFKIAAWLTDNAVEFVRFTNADLSTPGQFNWTEPLMIEPDSKGRKLNIPVVALIDESALSRAEYTAMALRAAGVTMIGGPTAGADGDISYLTLPMGNRMTFSGIGVFYPDKRPTQRVGIVPDILVAPTSEGFAEGRDEVLDRALQELRARSQS